VQLLITKSGTRLQSMTGTESGTIPQTDKVHPALDCREGKRCEKVNCTFVGGGGPVELSLRLLDAAVI
jgi:hypothetical protein